VGGLDLDGVGPGLPFALKTGTSTGFRDAWAFVFDEALTVGVWVGNFDGRPMVKTSGAAGATPLAVEVLAAARELVPVTGDAKSPSTGGAVDGSATHAWSSTPRITFPADGARFTLRQAERSSELVVRVASAPSGSHLLLNGRIVPWAEGRAVIVAAPGDHQARLVDAAGVELSRVTFRVAAL
jgi:membrane peptidoglycan carboxypeptidase